jgi:hypothetical protein
VVFGFWEELDSEIAEIAESTLARLTAAGAVLVDLNLDSLREYNNDLRPIVRYESRLDPPR